MKKAPPQGQQITRHTQLVSLVSLISKPKLFPLYLDNSVLIRESCLNTHTDYLTVVPFPLDYRTECTTPATD